MNQELMTLDFWQDTIIYEDKALPIGTLACDALNVSADTLAKMNEQCQKINLLLGMLNAGQDASALFPMAREAALTMLEILSKTPPFSYMDIPKHRERIEKVFTADSAQKYVEFATKAATNSLPFEEAGKGCIYARAAPARTASRNMNTFFAFIIFRQFLLKRRRNIRHITLACIVKQACKHHPIRQTSRLCLFCTANAMFPDRPERLHMTISSAYQGQRMCNICYVK